MNFFDLTLLPHLLWASFLYYAAMTLYTFVRSRRRIAVIFGVFMACCAMASLAYYYEVSLESLRAKIIWMQIKFIFFPFTAPLWLAIAVHLAGVGHWLKPLVWKLLLIVPVLTVFVALTSQYHELFRHHFYLEPLGPLQILHFQNGPWFKFYLVVANSVGMMGVFVMLVAASREVPEVRRRIIGLLAAYLLPVTFDILFQFGYTPFRGLNLMGVFFAPTTLIAVWLVLRHRMLNLEPIARSVLLDHMQEGVLLLDAEGKIADLNARAREMLNISHFKALRQEPKAFPLPWRDLFEPGASSPARVSIGNPGGGQQWVESSSLELLDRKGTSVGWLYLLRDVTSVVEREAQTAKLIRLEAEQKRLREQQLLIRDLHDGLGALGANLGMLAERGAREADPVAKNRLLDQINQLSCEVGMEVRDIMSSLESREFFWGDLLHNLRRYAALVLDAAGMEWALRVKGEIPFCGLGYSAGLSLFRVVREALNNLIKHAQARTVWMEFEFSSACCRIEIGDDGTGFDPDQTRSGGRGLKNMHHRVEELGGSMKLQTSADGTRLVFELPLRFPLVEEPLAGENDVVQSG